MDASLTLPGLLEVNSGYGYDLKHSYDRWFSANKLLASGQVYATFARLVRDGLITVVNAETSSGPERKCHEVTPERRNRIPQWLAAPDTPMGPLRSNLFAKTIVALVLDDGAERLLDIQRAEHMDRTRELRKVKKEGGLAEALLADHAFFHIEADLRWVDLTASRLNEPREDVRS